jgi:hypothetical protein
MEFFEYLLEMNSSRVQSDVMDRLEESQANWRRKFANCCTR